MPSVRSWLVLAVLLVPVGFGPGCVPDEPVLELTPAQQARVKEELLPTLPKPQQPANVVFGEAVELLGLELEPATPSPGGAFTLTWYWRCLKELDRDYQVFVHVDSQAGQKRMNLDHHPVQGLHPIMHWKKGEIIRDIQKDRIDLDFPVGGATIWMGIYLDDQRLPITPATAPNDGASRYKALTFQVKPGPAKVAAGADREGLPVLDARQLAPTDNLVVDGRLDEPAWQRAAWTSPFVLPHGKGGRPAQDTTAAFLWNSQELFLAFRVQDTDIWTSMSRDDEDLWNEEVVEAFFDPDGDGKTYVELQVNPANALFDAYFVSYRSDLKVARGYASRARHAVAIDGTLNQREDQDRGWTVELAIPFDALPGLPHVPPQIADEWRINLFRMDKPADGRQVAGAWSPPIAPDFHALKRFGRLRFVRPSAPAEPAMAGTAATSGSGHPGTADPPSPSGPPTAAASAAPPAPAAATGAPATHILPKH